MGRRHRDAMPLTRDPALGGITPGSVRERIAAFSADIEVLHLEEDRLRAEVLSAIADGHPEAQALAAAALKSSRLARGERWYA